LLAGGTTATGNLQQVSGVGTAGQVLTSNGAAALPTWQAAGGSSLWYQPTTPGGNMLSNGTGAIAGNLTMTGTNNFLAGNETGLALTAGVSNNFIGYQSGLSTTTGSYNTALGHQAGLTNITGSNDVFLGYQAGYYETGSNKLFIDNTKRTNEADARLKALVYGVFNSATTSQILAVNAKLGILDSGSDHYTYFQGGNQSADITYTLPTASATGLLKNTSGTLSWDTTAYNSGSGVSGRVAYWNGTNTLTSNAGFLFNGTTLTAPVMNITTEASGYQVDSIRALSVKGSSGTENLFLGQSGNFTMTNAYNNILVGYQAGKGMTTGSNNIFMGHESGYANTGGAGNNFLGHKSGYNNISGVYNSFLGYESGYNNISGVYNNFIGYQAGYYNTSGAYNSFLGYESGYANTSGAYNSFLGSLSGYQNNGSRNTFIGGLSGYSNVSGSDDVFLGYQAGYYETGSNKLFIDNQSRASEADGRAKALIYGVFDATVANQNLTVNANTDFSSGLTTLNYNTEAPTLTTNGQLAVAYVGTSNRLYWYSNGGLHYVNATAGFEIPGFETTDPLSGDKIEIGDFVVGMVNKNMGDEKNPEESSLHGIWVKWDSLKAELIQEIRANGGIAPAGGWASNTFNTIEGVDTTPMIEKVTNTLSSIGISVKNGITYIKELTVEKSTTQTARIQKLEMVDSSTGEVYCTWIEDGEWQKAKGDCASIKATSVVIETEQPPASAEEIKQAVKKEVKQELQTEIEGQVAAKIEEKNQEEKQKTESLDENLSISSVSSIDDILVDFGTEISLINLPSSITAVVSGSTQGLLVTWDSGTPAYNANTSGTYVFAGTLNNLSEGVSNPDDIKASVNVIVGEEPVVEEVQEDQEEEIETIEEQPQEESLPILEILEPVGDLLQDATAGLLNSMLEFMKWLFNVSFNKLSFLGNISSELSYEFQDLNDSVMVSLEQKTPSIMKNQTASVLDSLQNVWSMVKRIITK